MRTSKPMIYHISGFDLEQSPGYDALIHKRSAAFTHNFSQK